MSVDPAHSLADAFDLGRDLFDRSTADPVAIDVCLAIQEVNIQTENQASLAGRLVLRGCGAPHDGIDDVEAEELAILPAWKS